LKALVHRSPQPATCDLNHMQNDSPAAAPTTTRSTPLLIIGAAALALLTAGIALFVPGNWWQVVVLGIVEGLTEFLPISSTAHLLITADLLRFENSLGGTFEIFIQLGAVLAVLGFYARDLLAQARSVIGRGEAAAGARAARRFWLGVLIAFLPAALVGITLRDWIKSFLFESPTIIAWALIIGGVVFIVVERLPRRQVTAAELTAISLPQALGIGIAQVLALVPGVSRSGASIIGGMLGGLDRTTATAFSFYLAIPTLGAATVVDLAGSLDQITAGDLGRLLLGMVVSMVVAWASIGWLLRYVSRNSFVPFGIYRIAAGIVILFLVAMGQL
jgi:undecaprenyl-diphosphatase